MAPPREGGGALDLKREVHYPPRFRISGYGFRFSGFRFLVSGLGYVLTPREGGGALNLKREVHYPRVSGFRPRVSGFRFRALDLKHEVLSLPRKVCIRLPGKGNSNSHGARPIHLLIALNKTRQLEISRPRFQARSPLSSTLNSTQPSSSLYPNSEPLKSKPGTRGPKPGTRNPRTETRNPKPHTPLPISSAVERIRHM